MINRFILNEVSYFGPGAREVLPKEIARLGLHKALVVTDKDLIKFGVADKVLKVLETASVPYEVFSDVKPNPTVANVKAGLQAFAASGADFILAIGGGSSIDTSKAIGIITNNPEFSDVVSLEGVADTKNKSVPIIALPTTAGTAAEVTINYVITDEANEKKMVCVDPNDIPVVAVVDAELMYTLPKGLTASIKFSWDAVNTNTIVRSKTPNQYYAKGRDEDGNLIFGSPIVTGTDELGLSESGSGSITTYLEGSINYNRLFAEKHRVGAMLLYNHKVTNKKLTYSKTLSLPYKYQGLAGRVTYAFKDTYFAEFNMGYNGSENFAKGHRFGFFPAYAVGWMISNEKFWEPILPVVSELKLKASYGSVGNDAIGGDRWIYQSTISTNNGWNYGENGSEGGGGIQVGNVENLNVSWEKAYKTNLGFEMRLFDRIKIQADYFHEKREGVFINRQGLPAIVGLTTKPKTNIGASVNRGVDATLEYEEKVGEVFLTGRANFTFNRNKLLNNDEVEHLYKYQNSIEKTFGTGGNHTFGLIAEGLFQSQEEIDNAPEQNFGTYRVGDVRYRDVNGDGVVDTYDKVALGYTNIPEITYGFGLTAQWRSWDINAFFQGIAHCTFYIGGTAMRPFSTGNINQSAINADIYDHVWKTTNTPEQNLAAYYPRLSEAGGEGSTNNNQTSTLTMRDGRFLRLKNFEIGYTIPKSILEKTFIKSTRIYVSGSNLLTFSKFKLWDPETGSSDGGIYPPLRVFTIGLNAKF